MSRILLLCRESPNNTTFPRFTLQLLKTPTFKKFKASHLVLHNSWVGMWLQQKFSGIYYEAGMSRTKRSY